MSWLTDHLTTSVFTVSTESVVLLLLLFTSAAMRSSNQTSTVSPFLSLLQANEKVLVMHCKTNQALAVLGDQVIWYVFNAIHAYRFLNLCHVREQLACLFENCCK